MAAATMATRPATPLMVLPTMTPVWSGLLVWDVVGSVDADPAPAEGPVVELEVEDVVVGGGTDDFGADDVLEAVEVDDEDPEEETLEETDELEGEEAEEPDGVLVGIESDRSLEMVMGVATVASLAVNETFIAGMSRLSAPLLAPGAGDGGFAPDVGTIPTPIPVALATTVVPKPVLDPQPY